MSHTYMANGFDPQSRPELDAEDLALLDRRLRVLGAANRLFYERPVRVVRGSGVLLYDAAGNDYLDAYNNVPVVGHGNPRVAQAVGDQLRVLNTHTRYLTDDVVAYAERLTAFFRHPLSQVMFACSGSEAVDLALRVAAHVTGRRGVVVSAHAYHGTTRATAEVSPSLGANNPIPAHVALVDMPDPLRDDPATAAVDFERRIDDAVRLLEARGHAPGALLLDSVLSSDGLRPAPTAFLERAAAAIRRAGGLYIADEVQAGFGRTGAQWWGFAHYPVEPDMVVLGKPMGNGMPISAVIGRPDVFDRFGRDVRYFNTFAAGSAAVAAATAVLDELEERDLLASATKVGGRLASELRAITADDPRVAEVRATGLFLAVEIVAPGPDRAADAGLARQIVNGMRDRRVLISASGQNENVLKIRPPLVFAEEHIDRLCAAFADALAASARPA